MRELWLIRHAKSSWKQADLSDFERPLSGRGREDAPRLGRFLGRMLPGGVDVILCSPALRARQTAEALCGAMGISAEVLRFEPRLYDAGMDDLLEVIRGLPDPVARVCCVGHNPGMQDLVERCSGQVLATFPTCGAARFTGRLATWQAFTPGCLDFVGLATPANLDDAWGG